MEQFTRLIESLETQDPVRTAARKAWGITSEKHLRAEATEFKNKIWNSLKLAEDGITSEGENYLFYKLRRAFIDEDVTGLAAELKFAFMNSVLGKQYSAQVADNQKKLTDLSYPTEWYPATRAVQRRIHLHVGPTNSGKTYHALQRLEAAKTGIYAGPLRLLAHEVYTRLNAKGIPCALVTGEERRIPEGLENTMSSCTVEMVPLNTSVDVAVIDEIQMMGDPDRGWAWTQAFLGVRAKEVHLCGELRTVPLIRDICAAMGDKLEIHEYERLSPLQVSHESLGGQVSKLKKGDAVILFSRVHIHAMKNHIEGTTGKRCAIVYGSLPPETRAQQANLFNDPDNDYDFLVASDAVGMGLNLSIKRIIFDSTMKFNGSTFEQLEVPQLRQIAGRAGRYRTSRDVTHAPAIDLTDGIPTDVEPPLQLPVPGRPASGDNIGYVTTLDTLDLPYLREAMKTEPEPLKIAGILPPTSVLIRFAAYFPPTTPFSYILLRLHNIATLSPCFKLCQLKEAIEIADLIHPYDLTIHDRITFIAAPASLRDPGLAAVLKELAQCIANQSNGHILEIKSMRFELLEEKPEDSKQARVVYLQAIEALHKAVTLYLWLSYRYIGVFQSQALAFHLKDLVEKKINECLADVHWDSNQSANRKKHRLKVLAKREKELGHSSPEDTVEEKVELESEGEMEIVGASQVEIMDSSDTTTTPQEPEFSSRDAPEIVNEGPLYDKSAEQKAGHL